MRALIVDDDATSRLLLKAVVSKLGHECLVAEDGASAWDMLQTEEIDVLLTDWMMPGLSGLDLCRRVRNGPSQRYIYIVLITGLGFPEQVLEGMGAGADDYLVKPVDPFAVQTRLVAAERVTNLHHQVADFRKRLELANLELLGQSLTDALTGLGNRRNLERELASSHARAKRQGSGYTLAMFDIDHFKLYNDHYGHLAGDETLRRVARAIEGVVRSGEHVYRYGGEEFVLVMPDSDVTDALVAAARVSQAVNDLEIPHAARLTSPAVVTVSGGVGYWAPGSPLAALEVLHQADQALYMAKSAGRNCVQVAPGTHTDDFEDAPTGW
jgi:diguanylate cyclase (GGDEF)-like protein